MYEHATGVRSETMLYFDDHSLKVTIQNLDKTHAEVVNGFKDLALKQGHMIAETKSHKDGLFEWDEFVSFHGQHGTPTRQRTILATLSAHEWNAMGSVLVHASVVSETAADAPKHADETLDKLLKWVRETIHVLPAPTGDPS